MDSRFWVLLRSLQLTLLVLVWTGLHAVSAVYTFPYYAASRVPENEWFMKEPDGPEDYWTDPTELP
ncbi:hypothetical protein CSKR_111448 [Clonorchis sinensis]|uniref:Uncharacterized protein n=1 Tax=Clonorchis sinensis TaxID=79923 RepID=A0A8T1MIY0_CLOSI|nr:hypothetical protein CSKR_111448 [Clonorchis sinensis]